MIDRRSFLSALPGVALATPLAPASTPLTEPGMRRSFRKDGDGQWKEIRRQDTKKGDHIVTIGLDPDGTLWGLDVFVAGSDWEPPPVPDDGSGGEIVLGQHFFGLCGTI